MYYIIVHYRIMEVVRQQNEVKYVAHNRVSDGHIWPPASWWSQQLISFPFSIGCASCSNWLWSSAKSRKLGKNCHIIDSHPVYWYLNNVTGFGSYCSQGTSHPGSWVFLWPWRFVYIFHCMSSRWYELTAYLSSWGECQCLHHRHVSNSINYVCRLFLYRGIEVEHPEFGGRAIWV